MRQPEDRQAKLIIDQMVGLMGNYALALWRDGDARSYRDVRHNQNLFPRKGDGGYDLPRCRVDVKTSMMRRSQNPLDYNLAVRPKERYPDWVYALALVENFDMESLNKNPVATVHLAGWLLSQDLPEKPSGTGALSGAFTVPAMNLNPFPPLVYEGAEAAINAAISAGKAAA